VVTVAVPVGEIPEGPVPLKASTRYQYVVDAAAVVSMYDVVFGVLMVNVVAPVKAAFVARCTVKPVSLFAVSTHVRLTVVGPVAVAVRPVGAAGGGGGAGVVTEPEPVGEIPEPSAPLKASTRYQYVVEATAVVSVYVVVFGVLMVNVVGAVKPASVARWTVKLVSLLAASTHVRTTVVGPVALSVRPVGAAGGVGATTGVVTGTDITHAELPLPLVARTR
jgi:hypothetical protein